MLPRVSGKALVHGKTYCGVVPGSGYMVGVQEGSVIGVQYRN